MKTLLIDADALVYQSCLANEEPTDWGEGLWTLHAHLGPTIAHFEDAVAKLRDDLGATKVVMALSDYDDPWRKRIMPTYKSNRKAVRKPLVYAPLRAFVHETYDTYQKPGLEGDDVLGILLTNPKLYAGTEKVLVSHDKDMKTLPGSHVNMGSGKHFTVTPAEADYHHLLQCLTGDQTDGYPGCPRVGPVSGAKILDPFYDNDPKKLDDSFDVKGAWAAVVQAYEKAGLSEMVALHNAQVARICRWTDFDYVNKRVKPWQPPRG